MKRSILQKFLTWKNQKRRKPFILRGARQVGKTWSVIDFGRLAFKGKVHVVDLEKHLDWQKIFSGNLAAARILSELDDITA